MISNSEKNDLNQKNNYLKDYSNIFPHIFVFIKSLLIYLITLYFSLIYLIGFFV